MAKSGAVSDSLLTLGILPAANGKMFCATRIPFPPTQPQIRPRVFKASMDSGKQGNNISGEYIPKQNKYFTWYVSCRLLCGKPETSREEVVEAERQAYAHDFIASLPESYDRIIGELGATLSGGQRQSICLARAITKRPSALILDEPTSAVDVESEAFIHEALERLQRGKTTLVIAHHFA